MIPLVDVRDIALAHLQAIKIDEAKNKRIIVVAAQKKVQDIAKLLNRELEGAYTINIKEICYASVLWAVYTTDQDN